jgi:hypothetical protein
MASDIYSLVSHKLWDKHLFITQMLQISYLQTQTQTNGNHCGVHLVMQAKAIISGTPFITSRVIEGQGRQQLKELFSHYLTNKC